MANKAINPNYKFKFSTIDMTTEYVPVLADETENKGNDYINWGRDNKYPFYLYDLYCNCATLQSIINGSSDYTYGNGVVFSNLPESLQWENQEGDTLEDVITKIVLDRWIFGGFAFQIIYNDFGEITELIYLDFRNCRTDKKGNYVYYNENWNKGRSKALRYKAFNKNSDDTTQIFYFKGNKTRGVYPIPDWNAAIITAETQIKVSTFHYENVANNFNVNTVLNFNNAGNVSDEDKEKIEKAINKKFSGETNSSRLMIAWNEDKDKAVTVEKLTDDGFDKKYEALAKDTVDNIFVSMQATPILFGLNVSTGFNKQEFNEAFELYNKTRIVPKQKEIEKQFKQVFGMDVIKFQKFQLDEINTEGEIVE